MQKVMAVVLMLCTFLYSSEITVAVAANVSYAIKPLIATFKQTYPQTNVEVILGSSGKLLAQISHGAPYDLFLSANMQYPNRLYRQGLTVGKPLIYAQGALALLATQPHDFTKGLKVLEDASIHKIAIANPKQLPTVWQQKRHWNMQDCMKSSKRSLCMESLSLKLYSMPHVLQTLVWLRSLLFFLHR